MWWSRHSNPAALTRKTHKHSPPLLFLFLPPQESKSASIICPLVGPPVCLCLNAPVCLSVCLRLLQLLEPVSSSLPLWAGREGAEVTWSVYLSNHTVQVSALSVRSRGWTWRRRERREEDPMFFFWNHDAWPLTSDWINMRILSRIIKRCQLVPSPGPAPV